MARGELEQLLKGIKMETEHILGHQDKTARYADLPKMVQMNVDCNEGAKVKAKEPHLNKTINIQGEYCGIYYQGERIVNNMAARIEKAG